METISTAPDDQGLGCVSHSQGSLPGPEKIHLWCPNIFEFKGGIQVYSDFLLEALKEISPSTKIDVFLKHDKSPVLNDALFSQTWFHCVGHWPIKLRTLAFAVNLFFYGILHRPNLIIATHLNFSVVAYWLNQLLGIPYWAVAHGVDAWDITDKNLIRALKHADQIVAVSNYTRERLINEHAFEPDRVVLLPNTFDASRFQIAPKPANLLSQYNLTAQHKIILTVARLDSVEQYKGYDQIIRALPIICQKIPDVKYLLVGKGDDRSRIETLIEQLELQGDVILAGFVPDSELVAHYNLCDIFAMPSKGEGFGIVYLEALACGKPAIGGNQDGAIDALCDGELGVLVNPDDVGELAETVIKLLNNTYQHSTLYSPSLLREKVIEIFGFDQFKATLLSLLQSL